mmetsp:Transcript_33204/g.54173  ORF Transcript_33204/g.54173 Transcript_33204/m.54173 type:complete len:200 (+) Transcript_33204:1104-1703(+)
MAGLLQHPEALLGCQLCHCGRGGLRLCNPLPAHGRRQGHGLRHLPHLCGQLAVHALQPGVAHPPGDAVRADHGRGGLAQAPGLHLDGLQHRQPPVAGAERGLEHAGAAPLPAKRVLLPLHRPLPQVSGRMREAQRAPLPQALPLARPQGLFRVHQPDEREGAQGRRGLRRCRQQRAWPRSENTGRATSGVPRFGYDDDG